MSGVDVFHASNLVRNIPRRPKLTGTIYDMTVELFPQFHTAGNVRAENSFYERVLKRADGLIAISESSKNDAVRLLGLDRGRIAVIYPGIDERFFDAAPAPAAKPYVLFVGTIEPRKNMDTLLDAWAALPANSRRLRPVIAGPIGWASGATVARLHSRHSGSARARLCAGSRPARLSPPARRRSFTRRSMKDSVSLWRRQWRQAFR